MAPFILNLQDGAAAQPSQGRLLFRGSEHSPMAAVIDFKGTSSPEAVKERPMALSAPRAAIIFEDSR